MKGEEQRGVGRTRRGWTTSKWMTSGVYDQELDDLDVNDRVWTNKSDQIYLFLGGPTHSHTVQ